MAKPNVFFIFSDPSTQWKPLQGAAGTTGLCTPDMALIDNGNGDVVLSGTANALPFTYKGKSYTTYPAASATLAVQRGRQPKFAFNVVDSAGNTTLYFLNGVALKNLAAGGPGGANFPDLDVKVANDGTTTLNLQDNNQGAALSFDALILVQNSLGQVGLIDPLLTNSN
jgi:hypothetical protein